MSESTKWWIWGILLAIGAYFLLPYLVPFLVALLLAVMIEPLVALVQKTRVKSRIAAVWITLSTLTVALGIGLYFAVSEIVIQISQMYTQFPAWLNEAENWFWGLYTSIPPKTLESIEKNLSEGFSSWLSNSGDFLGRSASAFVNFASALPGMVILVVLTLLSFVLMSMHLPLLKTHLYRWFTPESQEKLDIIFQELNRGIIGFIRGQLLISFFVFLLTLTGLVLLRAPYALAMAAIVALVDLFPILGSGFVLIPWAIISFLNGQVFFPIGLVVVYVAITLFRRLIEPKILGDSLGMSTLTVLISMFLGFIFLGVIGLFVGPAVVVFFNALRKAGYFDFQIRI